MKKKLKKKPAQIVNMQIIARDADGFVAAFDLSTMGDSPRAQLLQLVGRLMFEQHVRR